METYIEKELTRVNPDYGKVENATKTIKIKEKFRVDAGFKPTGIEQICEEFIENYCEANNAIVWLLDEVNKTEYTTKKKNKETGEMEEKIVSCKNYPFVNLRSDFVNKFFPDILKGNGEKKLTIKERLNAKYNK